MRNRKWLVTERIELPYQEKITTFREKETSEYLVILEGDTIKQTEKKEKLTTRTH